MKVLVVDDNKNHRLYLFTLLKNRTYNVSQACNGVEWVHKKSERVKSEFLSRMSHEFRTQLNAIVVDDEPFNQYSILPYRKIKDLN